MGGFSEVLDQFSWEATKASILGKTPQDVERVLEYLWNV